MNTVVDASLLVAALVDAGPDGHWSRETLAGSTPIGPELVLAETTNVLRRLERQSRISDFQAAIAQRDAVRLEMQTFPFAPLAARVWTLRPHLTAYDGWYVALAEALACPLATLDRRLGRAARSVCEILTPPVDAA